MKQILIFAVIGFTCFTRFTAAEGADRVSFNRDIRPILSDACFQCHDWTFRIPDETLPSRVPSRSFRGILKRVNWCSGWFQPMRI